MLVLSSTRTARQRFSLKDCGETKKLGKEMRKIKNGRARRFLALPKSKV
jgi:hypothetical protein